MASLNDARCVQKYIGKKNSVPNKELVNDATEARKCGYRSYGEMQAAKYARQHTSGIKETIAQKRKEAGYKTVRERLKTKT